MGGPIIRTIVIFGSILGFPILGNYHISYTSLYNQVVFGFRFKSLGRRDVHILPTYPPLGSPRRSECDVITLELDAASVSNQVHTLPLALTKEYKVLGLGFRVLCFEIRVLSRQPSSIPFSPFLIWCFGASFLKLNITKKGILIIAGLLGNLVL